MNGLRVTNDHGRTERVKSGGKLLVIDDSQSESQTRTGLDLRSVSLLLGNHCGNGYVKSDLEGKGNLAGYVLAYGSVCP